MPILEVGVDAPEIVAQTGSGSTFRLSDQRDKSRVMLIFYPKDFTSGCSTQLANAQHSLADMRAAGVEPFGVNPDDADSHQRFCQSLDLEFEILVDEDAEAAAAYGAVRPEGGILRSVFVVGQDGQIEFAREGAPSWEEVAASLPKAGGGATAST